MSEMDAAVEPGAVATPDIRPGRMLADARAHKNLSVAEVAQQLKLSTGQIEALEAESYERLPGPVFVRGFVRNYARLLNLDAELLVANLNLRSEPAPVNVAMPHSQNIPFPDQRPVRWKGYAAGLLMLIAAVGLFELFFSAPQTVVVLPPPSQPEVPTLMAAPVPVVEQARVIEMPVPVVTQDTAPAAVAVKPAVPTATNNLAELHFVFETQSWVEVRDRNERLLFSQLNPAGTEQHLQYRPPLNLVVGNARGVRLLYKGQRFDLAPHTRVEVARFTLE